MRIRKDDPLTPERLEQLAFYEPETGLFRWKVSYGVKRVKGQPAGYLDDAGYLRLKLDGVEYMAHRVAWFAVHGRWPVEELDHVNGVRNDNRLSNLREASRSLNMQNQKRAQRGQKTGLLGVYSAGAGFSSFIQVNKIRTYLGYFATAEAAHEAYLKAKRELHPGNTL